MRAELEMLRAENRRLAAGGAINGKVGHANTLHRQDGKSYYKEIYTAVLQ
jgi:hypothetical protein